MALPLRHDDDGQQQAAGPLLVLLHCGGGRIKCPLQAFIRCVSLCLSPLSHFQYTFSFSFVVLSVNDLPSTMAFLWYNPPPSEFPFVPSSRRIRHSWRVKDIAIIRTASCRKKFLHPSNAVRLVLVGKFSSSVLFLHHPQKPPWPWEERGASCPQSLSYQLLLRRMRPREDNNGRRFLRLPLQSPSLRRSLSAHVTEFPQVRKKGYEEEVEEVG